MANDTIHAMAVKTDGALERDFEMLFNFITLCFVPDDFEIILTDYVCSYSYIYIIPQKRVVVNAKSAQ